MRRIQYSCRGCLLTFTNAADANVHHDQTGHHQTFRCPTCGSPFSAHSDGAYAQCMGEPAPVHTLSERADAQKASEK